MKPESQHDMRQKFTRTMKSTNVKEMGTNTQNEGSPRSPNQYMMRYSLIITYFSSEEQPCQTMKWQESVASYIRNKLRESQFIKNKKKCEYK